jgi:prostaglandin reductase 3
MAYRTIEVHTESLDYRAAMRIVEVAELPVATTGHVVVKNHYVGINAVDGNLPILNRSHGSRPLPYNCGLEGVGEVVAVGEGVENFKVGDAIAYHRTYCVIPH